MSTIKITDLNETTEVTTVQAENVKGGAAYIKFDGIDGESKRTDHKGDVLSDFSLPKPKS